MSFVKDQWVECVDGEGPEILGIRVGKLYRLLEVNGDFVCPYGFDVEYAASRFRPVEWQVGKTYKTTLEGVTATITRISNDLIFGCRSDRKANDEWCWENNGTGKFGGCDLNDTKVPRLTPYIAEPSPAVETTEPSKPAEPKPTPSRYHRTINGATLDLYDLADAYDIKSHRIFHAVKKLVLAGSRGHKDREQDLREAIVSIEGELQKMKGGAS